MDKEIDMLTPYIKGEKGGLIKYQGGPNFEKKSKPCPTCGNCMSRKPIGHAFINYEGEYLLVNIRGTDGVMIVAKDLEVEYSWLCSNCCLGHRATKNDTDVEKEV